MTAIFLFSAICLRIQRVHYILHVVTKQTATYQEGLAHPPPVEQNSIMQGGLFKVIHCLKE